MLYFLSALSLRAFGRAGHFTWSTQSAHLDLSLEITFIGEAAADLTEWLCSVLYARSTLWTSFPNRPKALCLEL